MTSTLCTWNFWEAILKASFLNAFVSQVSMTHPSHTKTYSLFATIAHAMEHLHENNVINGDLKPGNIFLNWFELIDSDAKYCLVKVPGSNQCVLRIFLLPRWSLRIYSTGGL